MTGELPGTDPLASPASSVSGGSGNLRKERGAIAAQACDTCRSRKQRCDEQRPKCGTCQKFKLDCHYREPQPTKKDKTLVEILERIKSLEGKFDSLSMQHSNFPTSLNSSLVDSSVLNLVSLPHPDGLPALPAAVLPGSEDGKALTGSVTPSPYACSVHQMLGWPAIQHLLESFSSEMPNVNIPMIESGGVGLMLGLNDPANRVPAEPVGPMTFTNAEPALVAASGFHLGGNPLTGNSMMILASSFFNTFDLCHPILDRHVFMTEVLEPIIAGGFTDSAKSALAFLVLALGEMAIAGLHGPSLSVSSGNRPSGVKGGTREHPPGLALYNEARRRMGFNLTEFSLEAIQVFALAGIYCGACFSHLEFWRMTTTASLACHALLTSNPSELSSPRADTIKRCFWYCCIIENYLGIELGLPQTGLESLEEFVGPPVFIGSFTHDGFIGTHGSLSQDYFVSAIALRRLSMEAHRTLGNGPGYFVEHSGAFTETLKDLSLQLDQWRGLLPPPLRWTESQPGEFPNMSQQAYNNIHRRPELSTLPLPMATSPPGCMFTTDLDVAPLSYPFNLDVQVAVLRSRYYYAKLIIYRQFIFKALSSPDKVTQEDAEGVAECLRVCLRWPVAMSPTCTHKRLVPCLFFWTQNMLGMLVLLNLSQQAPILSTIRAKLCGESFELEARETIGLYVEWIRDLKDVDTAAKWAWDIVRPIYGLEE